MLPSRKSDLRKCRYCSHSRPLNQMKRVTDEKVDLDEWIRILGKKFEENIKKTQTNFICRNHFDIIDCDGVAHGLPSRMKDEKQMQRRKRANEKSKCRYCDKSCPRKEMRRVTECQRDLAEWIRILGPKFAENIMKLRTNFICKNHFKRFDLEGRAIGMPFRTSDEKLEEVGKLGEDFEEEEEEEFEDDMYMSEGDSYLAQNLPTTSREAEKENENQNKNQFLGTSNLLPVKLKIVTIAQCRICSIRADQKVMREVPKKCAELFRWFEILGENFVENIVENSAPHFICSNHLRDFCI
ncbi:unnamed protein product [Caenorhabditis angaria]|uniref:THAP-type domain-containing protein n=1 Tax=Caenorhabditis angaria TaxID=860376 RepID=A0A9P1MTP5_9PELO|nr:unnamed protein product [Caenorhabditis angaria]